MCLCRLRPVPRRIVNVDKPAAYSALPCGSNLSVFLWLKRSLLNSCRGPDIVPKRKPRKS